MNLDAGDLFVVNRGFKLNTSIGIFALFGGMEGEGWKEDEKEPMYDRSFVGYVFRALEVCGPVIAAKIIHSPHPPDLDYRHKIGDVLSLHSQELELWPVTEKYLKILRTKGKES